MAVSYTHLDVYKRQPLACADDAVRIDSTSYTIEQIVDKIEQLIAERR